MRASPTDGAVSAVMGTSDGRSHGSYIRATKRLRAEAPSVCRYCGEWIDQSLHHNDPMAWTADHIVPLSECAEQGVDPNSIDNLEPAHRSCNSRAGALLQQQRKPQIALISSRIWH